MLRVNIHLRKEGFDSYEDALTYIQNLGLDPALTTQEVSDLQDSGKDYNTDYVETGEDQTRRIWINEVPME